MLSFIKSYYVSELMLNPLQILSLDLFNKPMRQLVLQMKNLSLKWLSMSLDLTQALWLQSLYY